MIIRFHKDNINWGNFSIRKTLYNVDQGPAYLSGMNADTVFNLTVSQQEEKFNTQGNRPTQRKFHRKKHSWLVNTIHDLCKKARIPMLSVVLFKTKKIGASTFLGTEIDVTRGALDKLSKPQLKAVLAHEVAHNVIKAKHIPAKNDETLADIIGAKLSSEQGMINVIKYFAKHVSKETDSEHYSDKKRIQEIKSAFKIINKKKRIIKNLEQKIKSVKSDNHKLQEQLIHRYNNELTNVKGINQKLKNELSQRNQKNNLKH